MRDFPDELDAVLAQGLLSSQRWFVACFVLSPCVYYFLDPYSDNRFPATISWTIRKGIPKWTQHFLWGMGWGSALLAMHHSGQSVWWQVFAVQMVCTGVLACVLFPIGLSPREDKLHHIAALAYMLNHIPMLYYWRIPLPYQIGFYSSLALFLAVSMLQRHLKTAAGLPPSGNGSTSSELKQLLEERKKRDGRGGGRGSTRSSSRAPPQPPSPEYEAGYISPRLVAWMYWLELAEMILENALFMCFVFGMPT